MDDADREITSYTVASDAVWFAIAYYWASETDSLPRVLRVRTLDRKNNVWRSALLDREPLGGGSALRIARIRQDVRVYPPTPDAKTVAGLIDRSIGTI